MTGLPQEPDRLFLWPEPDLSQPGRVATSHQPELFHAGIWVREFVLAELVGRGWEAVYFEADGADCEVEAVVPAFRPLRVERIPWARGPLERLPAPSEADWNAFLDRLERPGLSLFRGWCPAPNLARFLAGIRHQAAPHRLERRWQSDWARSPVFARLLDPILHDPVGFCELFNRVCREERELHGWRSRAHPFPELERREDQVELPLWWEGRPVWWHLGRRALQVDGRELPSSDPSRLRPRAVLWTAFCRLSADLYLHGTGGAAYDQATDRVLRRFYGLEPPPYAVVWLNYRLDLPADDQAPLRLAELSSRLRQLRYNPQLFLPGHPLSRARQTLVEELSQAPRGEKARLTRDLQALNASLASELAPLRAQLERQRAEAALQVEELTSAHFRGYSWLLADPRRLQAISCRWSTPTAPPGRREHRRGH